MHDCPDQAGAVRSAGSGAGDDAWYRLLFNNVSDAVFIHRGPDGRNLPGQFIEVNDVACRRLGYSREELLRMSPRDIDAPETLSQVPAMMATLYREGRALWEGIHVTKEGKRIPVEINNVLFPWRDETLILSTVRDITERKQTEEVLQEQAEQLRFIADNVHDAIWQMDQNICFTYVSPAVKRILGYEPGEIIGRSLFSFLSPAGADMVRPVWVQWYADLTKGVQSDKVLFEMEAVRKDGRFIQMEVQACPLLDADGKVIQYQGVTRDISDRRAAERERQQLKERLARAEKMESLGTLAGGVAHDLNNVLGVLVGYAELMMEKVPPENTLNRYASRIMKSSEKAAAIIQDLLTLARRGVAVHEVVDLNDIISDYFQTPEFEKMCAYHPRVSFHRDLSADLLSVKGSPVHIAKTITNLLSNAAESIEEAGEVTIVTENRYVDTPLMGYDAVERGDYVVLRVSDTGKGISAEDMGKIFEPFYTKKRMGRSGTGLGLAVVWGAVKDHQGYIDVQSEEGRGSKFTVYLPATREKARAADEAAAVNSSLGKGESVLVVDDVADQRELADTMLTRLGYRVVTAASGEEAVAYLKTNRADLAVIDMIMDPGMDGLDTYREIIKNRPQQRAIIVSGFSETDRVRQAQALGAGAYVRKPYVLEKIGLAIRKELDRPQGG